MADEQIAALNQITAMIDEKATLYKNSLRSMPPARAAAEKQLILKLIDDGLSLARSIKPAPFSLIQDLEQLTRELSRLG
ncbi:MAG: hypothetical protein K1X75_17115 [Leptospirales bacterium]|nr:hypothetical protein [Leptospirales bacterium]